jgi:hypothetical protein
VSYIKTARVLTLLALAAFGSQAGIAEQTQWKDGDDVWRVDAFRPELQSFVKGSKVIPVTPEVARSVEMQLRNGPPVEQGRFYVQLQFSDGPGQGVVTDAKVLFPATLQPWQGRR